jgi:hypothetical protein
VFVNPPNEDRYRAPHDGHSAAHGGAAIGSVHGGCQEVVRPALMGSRTVSGLDTMTGSELAADGAEQ